MQMTVVGAQKVSKKRETREPEAGAGHHDRRRDEQRPQLDAVGGHAEREGERGRAEQRAGHDRPDLHGREPEIGEVQGQQDAHVAVREAANRPARHHSPHIGRPDIG